jgi:hypothetical protein
MAYTSPNITTSGTTFTQLQQGGLTSVLETLITVNKNGTNAPTAAPTLSESGSGGTLPAATYFCVSTESNGVGETTPGPVSAGQAITLGEDLVVTYPALQTGNTARNLYVGTSSAGPFTLAATGVTASTTTISAPLPVNSFAVAPPTVNSTAFSFTDAKGNVSDFPISNIRSFKNGNFPNTYKNASQAVDAFLRGDPITFNGEIKKLQDFHTAIKVLDQACTDIGTLIDANPGTIRPTQDGTGNGTRTRTQP